MNPVDEFNEARQVTPPRRDYGKQVPTIGRIVWYHLTNTEIVPMIIVKVYSETEVGGQAFVDDDDGTHWVKAALNGSKPGEWEWPPRV